MKTVTPALLSQINALRAASDATAVVADCFLITLSTGVALAWTNADYPISYNGSTFSSSGPLISGLKFRASVGLEVDKQKIRIAARPTDTISGAQALAAIRNGAFDGAGIVRHRVFLSAPAGAVIGGVMLFHGLISAIDSVGRTQAEITVASDLILLDQDMPRNLFQATCLNVHYGSDCGVARGSYSASGAAASGSTSSVINWSGASTNFEQGSIAFTSGANANLQATIKSVVAGVSLNLAYPLPTTPAVGDAFSATYGCDHTLNTCRSRFSNLSKFRGFPYVPPPQLAY